MTPHRFPYNRAAHLAVILGRRYPQVSAPMVANHVAAAIKAAKQAKQIETKICNGVQAGVSEKLYARIAHNEKFLNKEFARVFGVEAPCVRLGGDCRGACGYLSIPDCRPDGFDESGWALY